MVKIIKAKLVLIQLEALQGCEQGQPLENYLALVNEIMRDAKELADATLEEESPKAS